MTSPNELLRTETRYLSVEGGRIAYDDTGNDGPLIIAIPGMGDLRSEYRYLGPILQKAGYRVVTMDVRGFGETSAVWNDYSARAIGQDALALIDHLHQSQAVILGTSFAAGSALWAAHESPEKVSSVVLLGPIIRDQPISFFTKLALNIGFAGPWRVWFWTTYWDSLFPTAKPTDHSPIKSALSQNLYEPGRMDALSKMVSLSKADTAAILNSIRVRTLVIMGTLDPDFTDAEAEAVWIAETLKGDKLIVKGAGHYPHTDMPDQVSGKILSFLSGAQGE